MKKRYFSLAFLFLINQLIVSQIVINELDCDSAINENLEFIELLSDTPNFVLNGYVLVFFNGSDNGMDTSYFTIDLDGYTTDVNGLLLIGSDAVSPVPQLLIPGNTIQNGADAVAVYQANWDDFPDGTLATIDNLIDVLLYDTADADDLGLIAIFDDFNPDIEQINEGAMNNANSIQLNNDGISYTVKAPTPRQLNDETGIVLNGVSISIAQSEYDEGDVFDIIFSTEQNVTEILNLDIILDNATFNSSDFSGTTSLFIPIGEKTTTTTITLIDDVEDEGDEVLKVSLASLPIEYLLLSGNVEVRVVDNDYTTAVWGEPTKPTFIHVSSTQPNDYYNSLDGKPDDVLRQALQDIIADPSVVHAHTYADVIDILKEADQNPKHSNQVWLAYTEQGRAKLDLQTGNSSTGKWNREHTFPRKLAGYGNIEADDIADGKNVFWITEADSLRHGNSDAHGLRAVDGPENSSRSDQHYGEYNGPLDNKESFKGDVARSVLYMAVRYNGLEIVNDFPDFTGQMGDLATLLTWHRGDPPDDFEMNRNNVIYNWQFNRNPFIDEPDLVEHIWGNKVGQVWDKSLSNTDFSDLKVKVYPNPTTGRIYINVLKDKAELELFSTDGRALLKTTINNSYYDFNVAPGIYFIKIESQGKIATKKIIFK